MPLKSFPPYSPPQTLKWHPIKKIYTHTHTQLEHDPKKQRRSEHSPVGRYILGPDNAYI